MSAEPGKVTTGIDGLDGILGGGLEEKRVYLVTGESGSGKTVFTLQYLHHGLRKGENAIYVTINKKPEDFLDEAKSLGWDLEEFVSSNRLIILDIVRYVELGAPLSVRQMMADLEKHIRRNDAKRLVIDSIDYLALRAADSERDMVTFVRSLVLAAEENLGSTTLMTTPVKAGRTESGITEMAERVVSGVFNLRIDEQAARRILSVRKMRKSGVSLLQYEYRIEPGKGIVVDKLPLGTSGGKVNIGEKIPDFSVRVLQDGATRTVFSSDYRGKWLVIVFYPGDFTFVCPTELVEMAGSIPEFRTLGAEVISISMDSILSHQSWASVSPEIGRITFPMGADPDGIVTRLFGVYTRGGTTRRATFIVDPEGVLVTEEVHDDRIGRSTGETLRKLAAAVHVAGNPDKMCPASWKPGSPDISVAR